MDENNIKKDGAGIASIIITQAVVTAIIILTVITVKYFFSGCYSEIKQWYTKEICSDTDVNEVLSLFEGASK